MKLNGNILRLSQKVAQLDAWWWSAVSEYKWGWYPNVPDMRAFLTGDVINANGSHYETVMTLIADLMEESKDPQNEWTEEERQALYSFHYALSHHLERKAPVIHKNGANKLEEGRKWMEFFVQRIDLIWIGYHQLVHSLDEEYWPEEIIDGLDIYSVNNYYSSHSCRFYVTEQDRSDWKKYKLTQKGRGISKGRDPRFRY